MIGGKGLIIITAFV